MARTKERLKIRDKFLILTNGKETEFNYFKLIKSKKSIYDVDVEYKNANPLLLIQRAIRSLDDCNQVWCVFDIDNSFEEGNLIEALNLATANGINYAFSNKAFEVWLISHFDKCEGNLNTAQLNMKMNEIIKEKLRKSQEYSKSDNEILKLFQKNINDAIINSKIVHQKWIKQHNQEYGTNSNHRIWEWNSCTNVYELVEALKLTN